MGKLSAVSLERSADDVFGPCQQLKLVKPRDYAEPSQRATEVKRMLTALIQKLKADR